MPVDCLFIKKLTSSKSVFKLVACKFCKNHFNVKVVNRQSRISLTIKRMKCFYNSTRCSLATFISINSFVNVLLQYYLTSRKFSTFDKLFSLMVSDHILHEDMHKYVVSDETSKSDEWLNCDDLAKIVDNYYQVNSSNNKLGRIF